MADAARPAKASPLRRDAVLEAVAFAAERLLLSSDWHDAAREVLPRLGVAARVSRTCITQNSYDERRRALSTLALEWCAPGVSSQIGNPVLQASPWEHGFGRWIDLMEAGEAIVGAVDGFPESEAVDLRVQKIVSLAYFPVTVDGDWWGCIGFDDCETERDWSLNDLDGLRTVATLLGAAIARQRQEERLRGAEARYRSVVEQIPAITYADVLDGGVARMGFVSPQIETLLGYPYERFLQDPEFWFELIHPEDVDRVDAQARRSREEGAAFDQEYRMRAADGRWVWVHDTSTPVRNERRELTHFQGFMIDITQRKEAERRLRDAETRYRAVVESIPAVTYIDEPTGLEGVSGARVTFVSPQMQAVLGYPPERFVEDALFWFDVTHPEDLARLNALEEFSAGVGGTFDQEYRMRHADGHWVWVHDTSTTVYRDDGSIAYFQGFMIDVTARHEAEEQLKVAEERFRVLVEQMPAVIYTELVEPGTARAVAMDYVSPQAVVLLGYPIDEWLHDVYFWDRIVHPEDRELTTAAVEHANGTGEPMSIDYRLLAADSRTIWIHEEAVLIRGLDRTPVHWQGFMLDITDRKEAEQRVLEAEERYRAIVEHTPVITYQQSPAVDARDPSSAIVYVSPQIQGILGYPPEDWTTPGRWREVMHPDDLERVLAEAERTTDSGEPYRQDYRMIASDGHVVWFHDEAHLIRDASGLPVTWQGVMVDITERKGAEDQLRRAQERLQALVEHIPAVVYTETPDADPHGFYLSPQVEQIFGYTAEEWTWTPDFWLDHLHPDDRGIADEEDHGTDLTRDFFSVEYRFRKPDGSYMWVHDEAIFVPTDGGEGFWQGFLFDVTARKEAEQQALEAERVLRATVEHLPAVVYREAPDHDTQKSYVSPQTRWLFGYEPQDWVDGGRRFWSERIHPDDRDRVTEVNDRSDVSKEPYSTDYRFRRADGSYLWIHDEASFVAEEGREGFWQGFMLDIAERTAAETQLREAEEKFRTIVEQHPAVIYTQEFDPENPSISRTTYISPRQPEVFGYSTAEVLGDPTLWTRMIHPDDRDRVLSADLESNTARPDLFSLEYRMIAKDGRIVWVQDDAQLVRIEGQAPFWQGFLLDITERKLSEEQLARALEVEREATRRLRALDEMKNTFLQAVSHDLRTPLAAILGLAITLERGDMHLEEEDSRDLARRIAGNARRLDRLVTNLLDLDRLARGIVTPKLLPTDVGSLVRRVVAESELIADARLRTDIQPVVVPVDGAKLERIVENLLANTARHTPPEATIWVSVRPTPDGVLLTVEDDGPGVAEDLREVIFEPFQQGPDAPQHSPGVGVGLTLVRRFAELHGGRAWVEEREGGGASFRVFLPSEPPAPGGTDEA